MTPDQIDKAIQFLLEQLAALEATLESGLRKHEAGLQESRKLFNEGWEMTQGQIREVDKQNQANSEQIRQLGERIDTLRDACRDLLEHAGYTDFRLNRLENPEH